MGRFEKDGQAFVYRQDDGEITSRFDSMEEPMVLAHEGSALYKKLFYFLSRMGRQLPNGRMAKKCFPDAH